MISLTDCASTASALTDPDLDPDLRALIRQRTRHLSDDTKLFVVERGDSPEVINEALGFPITGDQADEASYDWIEDHGRWFEIALHPSDDGPTRIFVENGPGTELGIHYLCQSHFWFDDEGSRR